MFYDTGRTNHPRGDTQGMASVLRTGNGGAFDESDPMDSNRVDAGRSVGLGSEKVTMALINLTCIAFLVVKAMEYWGLM